MIKQSIFLLGILLVSLTQSISAQDIEIPEDFDFEQQEDRDKYEAKVIEAIDWLEVTPVIKDQEKRKSVNAFVLKWILNTEKATIAIASFQLKYFEKNSELLLSFMGGWTKYSVEHPDKIEDQLLNNAAGFESIKRVYSNNINNGMVKDKNVEKLLKMSDEKMLNMISKEIG